MKTYVISLERTPERLASFKEKNGWTKEFEHFPAIDGYGEDLASAHGVVFKAIVPGLRYSRGAVGCALSHIKLWEKIAQEKEPAIILEDDAILHAFFENKLEGLLEEGDLWHEKWDMVVLGWNMDCPIQFAMLPQVTPCQGVFFSETLAKTWETFKSLPIYPIPYKLEFCFGTPGYILKPHGAKKLLDKLLPLRNFTMDLKHFKAENKGIDVALCSAYRDLEAYISFPPLLITPNEHSSSTVLNA